MRSCFATNIYKMSAVSTSRPKKVDPLSKRVPSNPKYSHVRSTIDTGASITKYMERIEDMRANYRFKTGEIFRRMKVTTFVQLVVQVAEYDTTGSIDNGTFRPDTADNEVYQIQKGGGARSPAPSLAVTEGDYGGPPVQDTTRSTLQGVIRGEGELDRLKPHNQQSGLTEREKKILDGCPYLLLDVRDADCFKECHITTAKNYPKAMLSRACNFETKDMLDFKNREGKIIILYDENEQLAPNCATTLVQKGYDNIFLLSGGMKVAFKIFPEGLLTGSPPPLVLDSARPTTKQEMADKDNFSQDDLDQIQIYLDNALCDKSYGSRLSKASTTSSRMSNFSSTKSTKPPSSVASGRVSHAQAFK